jgi:hypothetical protein
LTLEATLGRSFLRSESLLNPSFWFSYTEIKFETVKGIFPGFPTFFAYLLGNREKIRQVFWGQIREFRCFSAVSPAPPRRDASWFSHTEIKRRRRTEFFRVILSLSVPTLGLKKSILRFPASVFPPFRWKFHLDFDIPKSSSDWSHEKIILKSIYRNQVSLRSALPKRKNTALRLIKKTVMGIVWNSPGSRVSGDLSRCLTLIAVWCFHNSNWSGPGTVFPDPLLSC